MHDVEKNIRSILESHGRIGTNLSSAAAIDKLVAEIMGVFKLNKKETSDNNKAIARIISEMFFD